LNRRQYCIRRRSGGINTPPRAGPRNRAVPPRRHLRANSGRCWPSEHRGSGRWLRSLPHVARHTSGDRQGGLRGPLLWRHPRNS